MKEVLEYKLIELDGYSLSLANLIAFVAVLVVARVLLWLLRRILFRSKSKLPIDFARKNSLYLIIKYFVWVVAIVIALQAGGVNITILLAGSAALFVGLGFGLQQLFNDMVSGIILLFDGTIQVGDIIEVDGIVAEIEEINLRTSNVRSQDDIVMVIPNHKFVSENVINWSKQRKHTRFRVQVGVSYDSDVNLVREVLERCMEQDQTILREPHKPFVRFVNFGESSLDFECVFWSYNNFAYQNTNSELRFRIFNAFREHGITIPFPQRDLHIKSGGEKLRGE